MEDLQTLERSKSGPLRSFDSISGEEQQWERNRREAYSCCWESRSCSMWVGGAQFALQNCMLGLSGWAGTDRNVLKLLCFKEMGIVQTKFWQSCCSGHLHLQVS